MTINEMIREMKAKGFSYKVIADLIDEEMQKKYIHISVKGLSPQRLGVIASITSRECTTTCDIRDSIKKTYRRLCK
jgi:hypothetical protein